MSDSDSTSPSPSEIPLDSSSSSTLSNSSLSSNISISSPNHVKTMEMTTTTTTTVPTSEIRSDNHQSLTVPSSLSSPSPLYSPNVISPSSPSPSSTWSSLQSVYEEQIRMLKLQLQIQQQQQQQSQSPPIGVSHLQIPNGNENLPPSFSSPSGIEMASTTKHETAVDRTIPYTSAPQQTNNMSIPLPLSLPFTSPSPPHENQNTLPPITNPNLTMSMSMLQTADMSLSMLSPRTTTSTPATSPFIFTRGDIDPRPNLLSFHHLSAKLNGGGDNEDFCLQNISGAVRLGGMTAVIGCGGAGKSVLLQSLTVGNDMNHHDICQGEWESGVFRVRGSVVRLPPFSSYQISSHDDSSLLSQFTVRETLTFSAQIHQQHENAEIQHMRIQSILNDLDLDVVGDNVIGSLFKRSLSGGEKKRTTIGNALASGRHLIMVDDVLDGLDSHSALSIVKSLKIQIHKNLNLYSPSHSPSIIHHDTPLSPHSDVNIMSHPPIGPLGLLFTLHQPSAELLDMFDDVLILHDKSQLYFGSVDKLSSYLEGMGYFCPKNMSISDYFLHIVDRRMKGLQHLGMENYGRQRGEEEEEEKEAGGDAAEKQKDIGFHSPNGKKQKEKSPSNLSSSSSTSVHQKDKNTNISNHEMDASSPTPIIPTKSDSSPPFSPIPLPFSSSSSSSSSPLPFSDDVNFPLAWSNSRESALLSFQLKSWKKSLQDHLRKKRGKEDHRGVLLTVLSFFFSWLYHFSFHRFSVLLHRFHSLAKKDLTLYYLQFLLTSLYGFLVGLIFWGLPFEIGSRQLESKAAILWIFNICIFIQVFRVYYANSMKAKFRSEAMMNHSYNALEYMTSQFVVTATWMIGIFIPGLLLAYAMTGMPLTANAVGVCLFIFYLSSLASESLIILIVELTTTVPSALLFSQGLLLIISVFAGVEIRPSRVSGNFWIWVSEISLFRWSVSAASTAVYSEQEYFCPEEEIDNLNQQCIYNNQNYPCDALYDPTNPNTAYVCRVKGSTVLNISSGVVYDDVWSDIGYLVLIMVVMRIIAFVVLNNGIDGKINGMMRYFTKGIMGGWRRGRDVRNTVGKSHDANRHRDGQREESSSGVLHDIDIHIPIKHDSSSAFHSNIPNPFPSSSHSLSSSPSHSFPNSLLHWHKITMKLPSRRTVVDEVSGFALSGELFAILGASAAGKTTLFNGISGRYVGMGVRREGEVLLNGIPLHSEDFYYMQQQDIFYEYLTVRQTLQSQWELFTADYGNQRGETEFRDILSMLDLTALLPCPLHSLSLSEKKRVSLALSLTSRRSVLLIDEPTTQLDSETAKILISYLRYISKKKNLIIMATIHQPSTQLLHTFDRALLMTKGQTAYFGEVRGMKKYFRNLDLDLGNGNGEGRTEEMRNKVEEYGKRNEADFYLRAVSKNIREWKVNQHGGNAINNNEDPITHPSDSHVDITTPPSIPSYHSSWKDQYLFSDTAIQQHYFGFLSHETPNYTHPTVTSHPYDTPFSPLHPALPSEYSRFKTLLHRCLLANSAEFGKYGGRSIQLLLMSFFLGSLYYRLSHSIENTLDFAGSIFFSSLNLIFSAVTIVPFFVVERDLFLSEYLNGAYGIISYSFAHVISSIPFNLFNALLFQSITWFMIGYNDHVGPFLFSVLNVFLLLMVMEALSRNLCQSLKSAMLSTSGALVVLGGFALSPGFFITVPHQVKSIAWFSYTSPTKYSLQSILNNIYEGQQYTVGVDGNTTISGEDILSQFFPSDMSENKWRDMGILMVFVVGMNIQHAVGLLGELSKFGIGKKKKQEEMRSGNGKGKGRGRERNGKRTLAREQEESDNSTNSLSVDSENDNDNDARAVTDPNTQNGNETDEESGNQNHSDSDRDDNGNIHETGRDYEREEKMEQKM